MHWHKGEKPTLTCGAVGDEDGDARRAGSPSSGKNHVVHRGVNDASKRAVGPGGAGGGGEQHVEL